MWKLTRLSSLQETKSLASHPLRKNPQSLVSKKMKMKEKEKKQSKALYILYIYISIYISISDYMIPFENKLPRAIYKENYKTKYLRLFTPFPNLISKESYNWWVTRRKWGFRHQKSEEKYLKESVHKYREALRTVSQVKTRSATFHRRTKRAAKSLRSKRLISQRCEVVFQLAVFGFQRVRKYRETSGGIPQHCAKWLRNHFATKG